MVKLFNLLTLLFILFAISCTEQHKPFEHWKQIAQERKNADVSDLVFDEQGNKRYLDENGVLVSEGDAGGDAGAMISAADIYSQFCFTCHGANGEGNAAMKGRNFQDSVWQDEATDEEIHLAIKEGTTAIMNKHGDVFEKIKQRKSYTPFTGLMLPSGGRSPTLTDEQVNDMIKVIRGFRR